MISIRVSQQQKGKNLMPIPEDNGGGRKNFGLIHFLSREVLAIAGMTLRETDRVKAPGSGYEYRQVKCRIRRINAEPGIDHYIMNKTRIRRVTRHYGALLRDRL